MQLSLHSSLYPRLHPRLHPSPYLGLRSGLHLNLAMGSYTNIIRHSCFYEQRTRVYGLRPQIIALQKGRA
ncbi:hypothetical protein BDV97DRAFT_42926 [Delphinella strobiligena]|nr:hypothetical protein BDV97DRAFT_42926 [Delphinella strobiligena]